MLGFAFAGIPGSTAETPEEAHRNFAAVTNRSDLRVVIVTEQVAEWIDADLTDHRLSTRPPFVVEIPDIWNTPVERRSLETLIQEAVGIRITKKSSTDEGEADTQPD